MLTTNIKFYSGLVTVPVSYCQHHYGLRPSGGIARVVGPSSVWWFGGLGFFLSGPLVRRGMRWPFVWSFLWGSAAMLYKSSLSCKIRLSSI